MLASQDASHSDTQPQVPALQGGLWGTGSACCLTLQKVHHLGATLSPLHQLLAGLFLPVGLPGEGDTPNQFIHSHLPHQTVSLCLGAWLSTLSLSTYYVRGALLTVGDTAGTSRQYSWPHCLVELC